MKLSDFDYVLPSALIASYPTPKRADARLFCLDRQSGGIHHLIFKDISKKFRAGDVLVLNNTKVIPARIFGLRPTGGKVEGLLLRERGNGQWEMLLRPGGRIKKNTEIEFGNNGLRLKGIVVDEARVDSGERLVQFEGTEVKEKLFKIGHIPLPPYIDRADASMDREMYQTVFAQKEGAVAAPTAGLHFDEALLEVLKNKGVEIVYVTLHVSYGTFQPVTAENLNDHQMIAEEFEITEEVTQKINLAKKEERRIIACGTTATRTLEAAAVKFGEIQAQSGKTNLFIYPPYTFKIINGLITNFHLPKSSLILLVSAFAGRDKIFNAYEEAIRERYRFYSYGDAMLIL